MSYNIHHCNPPSRPGIIDLDAIVQAISRQNPDIIALQEVDVNTGRSGKIHQASEIARKLHMHYFFGKAIDHDGGEYGVAILSKYPLTETSVLRLPTKEGSGGEPRVLATAKVALSNNHFIRFGATHLDAQREPENRLLQIKEINSIAARENLPFLLAGDFNATPKTEVIKNLDLQFKRTCDPCAFTFPEKDPDTVIDFIAFKPRPLFHVVSHQVIEETYASDHRPVMAVLSLVNSD
jgi:endonuclease/exonuclease/phosphatase family metal-dependent hydrolase